MKRAFRYIFPLLLSFLLTVPSRVYADVLPVYPDPIQTVPSLGSFAHILFYLIFLFITLVLELPVYLASRMWSRREILAVVAVNAISYAFFYTTLWLGGISYVIHELWDVGSSNMAIFIGLEVIVVLIELFPLKLMLKHVSWIRLVGLVLLANVISAVIGTYLFSLIF